MIQTAAEYEESKRRVAAWTNALAREKERLEKTGLDTESVERALMPRRSFLMQIQDEVSFYEQLCGGQSEPG